MSASISNGLPGGTTYRATGRGGPAQGAAAILARLDRLPATRHIWTLVALLSLGGMFEFYDLFMTGYVAPGLVRAGLLTGGDGGHVLRPAAFRGRHLHRPVHRHVRVRLRRRPVRATGDLHLVDAGLLRGHAGDGVPGQRLRRLPLAADRRDRDRRRAGDHRHLHRRDRAQASARPGLRLQPDDPVCRRAGGGVPGLRAGPAGAAGLGWLALGGGDRRRGRAVRVVPASRDPGKPALADQPWQAGRGGSGDGGDRGQGEQRPRRCRAAGGGGAFGRGFVGARQLRRDLAAALSQPHHHADGVPVLPDLRLLRLRRLGADDHRPAGRDQSRLQPAIRLHHRAREPVRTAARHELRRQVRAQNGSWSPPRSASACSGSCSRSSGPCRC